jgi:hypothetical protein
METFMTELSSAIRNWPDASVTSTMPDARAVAVAWTATQLTRAMTSTYRCHMGLSTSAGPVTSTPEWPDGRLTPSV